MEVLIRKVPLCFLIKRLLYKGQPSNSWEIAFEDYYGTQVFKFIGFSGSLSQKAPTLCKMHMCQFLLHFLCQ